MTQGSIVVCSLALCGLSLVGEVCRVSWASSTTSVLQRYNDMSLGSSACVANAEVTHARNARRPSQPLDATAQYYLRPWFGDLVDKVRVVWKARLNDHIEIARRVLPGGSRAQTYGYQVYMAPSQRARDPGNPHQLILLAHELVHTEQYVRAGESLPRFCQEYVQNWAQSGGVYAQNPLEQEAFEKAFVFAQWLGRQVPSAAPADQMAYRHEGDKPPARQTLIPRRVPQRDAAPQMSAPQATQRP
jgi:hypothetical protein